MSKTCVVASMDRDFVTPTEVMLRSLDATYKGSEKLDVKILVPSKMADYQLITEFKNINVEMVPVPQMDQPDVAEVIDNTYRFLRLPPASMHRYFMADLLPSYTKAVYVDSDTIIARDISPMLDYELQTPLAAYPEIQLEFADNPTFKDAAYFNSGVMIVDLKWWRNNRVSKSLLKIAQTMKDWTGSGDQDVLNALFRNQWTPLPMGFNYLINIYVSVELKDPIVVHWAGKTKPWLSNSPMTKWKQLWKQYKNQSPTTT